MTQHQAQHYPGKNIEVINSHINENAAILVDGFRRGICDQTMNSAAGSLLCASMAFAEAQQLDVDAAVVMETRMQLALYDPLTQEQPHPLENLPLTMDVMASCLNTTLIEFNKNYRDKLLLGAPTVDYKQKMQTLLKRLISVLLQYFAFGSLTNLVSFHINDPRVWNRQIVNLNRDVQIQGPPARPVAEVPPSNN